MTTKSLTDVQIKDADKGLVTAVVSTFGVIDKDGDVTSKSTFTDGAAVVVSDYGHASWDAAGFPPIGIGVLKTTDTEAIAELKFFLDTARGRDVFTTIKHVSDAGLQEWSYSLWDTVSHKGELDGRPANFLDSTFVKEVSPVMMGASVNTRTLTVKSADLKFSEHADAVLTDVAGLIARAADVVTLRAADGKTIGASSLELLKRLDGELLALKALIDEPDPTPSPDDEAQRELLHAIRRELEGALR